VPMQRSGNQSTNVAPRNIYACADGHYVALSGSMQSMAEKIFRTIGRADLIDDPRFRTNDDRMANRDALDEIIGRFIRERSRSENLSLFEAAGVTVGPVHSVAELIDHPYVLGREILVEMADQAGSLPMHNVVVRFSATPGSIRRGAPAIDQDREAILAELEQPGARRKSERFADRTAAS
jgi:crotonobetainyl-CoA:carnitine CoA-transferase CaiB-like acyl-CoA transferase